jgi:hypothetical protein
VKHAALLLAAQFTAMAKSKGVSSVAQEEVVSRTRDLVADYGGRCHWSKQFVSEDGGSVQLAENAMALLEAFGLVTRGEVGWRLRPAIARFAPAAPEPGV